MHDALLHVLSTLGNRTKCCKTASMSNIIYSMLHRSTYSTAYHKDTSMNLLFVSRQVNAVLHPFLAGISSCSCLAIAVSQLLHSECPIYWWLQVSVHQLLDCVHWKLWQHVDIRSKILSILALVVGRLNWEVYWTHHHVTQPTAITRLQGDHKWMTCFPVNAKSHHLHHNPATWAESSAHCLVMKTPYFRRRQSL